MPLSAPSLLASLDNYASTSTSSPAFTPSNNSLLIVVVGARSFGSTLTAAKIGLTATPSISFTQVLSAIDTVTNSRAVVGAVFTAQITTGVSTTLVVTSSDGSDFTYQLSVIGHTGHNTSTPIGATATGTNEGLGAVSITLSGAPASTSYVYGASYRAPGVFDPGWTVGTGWTQLYQDGYDPDGNVSGGIEYVTGTTSTSVSWVDITSDTTTQNQVELGFEVQAAGASGTLDRSWLFQPSANLKHPATHDTNQPRDNFVAASGITQHPLSLRSGFSRHFLGQFPNRRRTPTRPSLSALGSPKHQPPFGGHSPSIRSATSPPSIRRRALSATQRLGRPFPLTPSGFRLLIF